MRKITSCKQTVLCKYSEHTHWNNIHFFLLRLHINIFLFLFLLFLLLSMHTHAIYFKSSASLISFFNHRWIPYMKFHSSSFARHIYTHIHPFALCLSRVLFTSIQDYCKLIVGAHFITTRCIPYCTLHTHHLIHIYIFWIAAPYERSNLNCKVLVESVQ